VSCPIIIEFKNLFIYLIYRAESVKFLKQFEGQDEEIITLHDVIPRFTLNSICGGFSNIITMSSTFLF